jgi:hypothetical protein
MMVDSWFCSRFFIIIIIFEKYKNAYIVPKIHIFSSNPISHIPMILAFTAFFFCFNSPWIDENSGHRGRRVPLYQGRRRTWSVAADRNMTKIGVIVMVTQM